MIINFTFGNFRSFKNQSTFSMIAASKIQADSKLDAGNIVHVSENPPLSLLRVAAIYGANASGKSNIAQALQCFRHTVANSANVGFHFSGTPFLFSESTMGSTVFFELTFITDGVQYRYGFEIKPGSNEVKAEWLYRATSPREATLFEREGDIVDRKRLFSEGTAFLKDKQVRRKDALFLSLAAQSGENISKMIVDYCRNNIAIVSGVEDRSLRHFTEKCIEDGQYHDTISHLMREADTGISGIYLAKDDEINKQIPVDDEMLEEREQAMRQAIVRNLRIQSQHHVFDAEGKRLGTISVPMALFESQGTQKLFAFAGPISETLAIGKVLFVDEMDAKFHPMLTKALIGLFQSPTSNPKNAQLIFITHDTNLLDRRSLRRDQVWFVEKDHIGASHLYSLADFKGVRKGRSFEDDYIAGRFGAIPLLGDLTRLLDTGEANSVNVIRDENGIDDEA